MTLYVAVMIDPTGALPPDVFGPFDTEDESRRWIAQHRNNQQWDAREVIPV